MIQFARLYRQKQLLHKTDLVEMFTVWKSYLHGFGVCTIHASRKYPQNVDDLSNIVPLPYFDRIKHLSVAIGTGWVDSQSVIERRLLNSKSPIEPGKDYIQPRRPRGCLAVQNSSIGDLVCLSDRTNNQSLHKPTEWSHTLVTFGTFDQSDEETWPDQKRSTYLPYETDYNTDNWEPGLMTIFVAWQLIVTLDSIRNSCDVYAVKHIHT